jgi:hypothetical protein
MIRSIVWTAIYKVIIYPLDDDTVWGNKTNDTRYNKTFQTVWYANDPISTYPKWPNPLPAGAPGAVVASLNLIWDTAIYMPGADRTTAQIAASRPTVIPPSLQQCNGTLYDEGNDTKELI